MMEGIKMNKKLFVSPAPQITSRYTTLIMMLAMVFALVPASVFGVVNYGIRVLYHILIGVAVSFVCDRALCFFKDKKIDWLDISSVVTGFMVAILLPVSAPLWTSALGSVIAIFIFKFCFGGLGKNIFNPAASARVILAAMFTGLNLSLFTGTAIGANVASPLYYFANSDYSFITIRSLFFGSVPGAIGTSAIICILICGILLMAYRITDFTIPIGGVLTFIAVTWIGKGAIAILPFLFSGSFLFALMFMVTDPVTSPNTVWGKLVYGLLFGIFAGLFRVTNIFGETSVFVAVLMVNLCAPLLDKIFQPRPLGLKEVK